MNGLGCMGMPRVIVVVVAALVFVAAAALAVPAPSAGEAAAPATTAAPPPADELPVGTDSPVDASTTMAELTSWCEPEGLTGTDCSFAYWDDFTRTHGVRAAFDDIEALKAADRDFIPLCHHAYHAVGQTAPELFTVPEALDMSTPLCQAGYIHGVVQTWTSSVTPAEAREQAPVLCDPLRAAADGESLANLCAHGVGHALAIHFPGDIYGTADICAPLETSIAAACFEGILMEYAGKDHATVDIRAELGSVPADAMTDEIRATLCETVDARLQEHCYLKAFQLWDDIGRDAELFAQRCQAAPTEEAFKNCGRAFADMTFWDTWPTIEDPPEEIAVTLAGCDVLADSVLVTACYEMMIQLLWRDEPLEGAPVETVCPGMPDWALASCEQGEELALLTRSIA